MSSLLEAVYAVVTAIENGSIAEGEVEQEVERPDGITERIEVRVRRETMYDTVALDLTKDD